MTPEQLANLKAFAEAKDAQFDREVVLELVAEVERLTRVVDQTKRLLSGEEIKVRHVDEGGFIVAKLFEDKKGKRNWHAILVAVDAHELADLIKQWEAEDAP